MDLLEKLKVETAEIREFEKNFVPFTAVWNGEITYKQLQAAYKLPFIPRDSLSEQVENLGYSADTKHISLVNELQNTKFMSSATFRSLTSIECASPVIVKLNGYEIAVGCGKCAQCLAKRRKYWSKRLVDETQHNRHLYAFGVTLTYNRHTVPNLPREKLEVGDYTYWSPNKSHTYLVVKRGCSPKLLKTEKNIGLLYSYDLDLYFKSFRKMLDARFPDLYARYFFAGEYGEIDDLSKVRLSEARCGMPHYHGIWFIGFKASAAGEIARIKENLPNDYQSVIEKIALDAWRHCEQRWDNLKQIFIGKSIQKFGEKWGDYLGKYISKETTAKMLGCRGSSYIPERCWCSRCSPKLGLPSLGVAGFAASDLFKTVYEDLKHCVKYDLFFAPSYKENGFDKALPPAYRIYCIERMFRVKMSRYSMYRRYMRAFERSGSRDVRLVCSVKYVRSRSIVTPPKYHLYQIGDVEEIPVKQYADFMCDSPVFKRMTALYNWKNANNIYYLSKFADSIDSFTDSALVLDDAGWHCNNISPELFASCLSSRQAVITKVQKTFNRALEKKQEHNLKNGYVKRWLNK